MNYFSEGHFAEKFKTYDRCLVKFLNCIAYYLLVIFLNINHLFLCQGTYFIQSLQDFYISVHWCQCRYMPRLKYI